jgi:adenosine 3'-phospho 5'-phosphosulfate transporter B2
MKTLYRTGANSGGAPQAEEKEKSGAILPVKIDDKLEEKGTTKSSPDNMSRNLKLLFCFIGLQVSYVLWGIVQEQLMTQEYKMGRFKSSAFCVFGNRFLALFISMAIVAYKRLTATKAMKEAPYYYYAPSSLSNTVSSWAQYEALKFVSFPTQVLSKSCKLIPVMLVSVTSND